MTGLLSRLLEMLVCWIQTGIVLALNFVIEALGALWEFIVDALPEMPDYPDLPGWAADAVVLLNEIVDVAWILAWMTSFLTIFLIVLGLMALLRWLKAAE